MEGYVINYELAEQRNLRKRDIKALEALHKVMSGIVKSNNRLHSQEPHTKAMVKDLRKTVRSLEYIMQAIWGFDEDKTRHYHWMRFDCLHPKRAGTGSTGVTFPKWVATNAATPHNFE